MAQRREVRRGKTPPFAATGGALGLARGHALAPIVPGSLAQQAHLESQLTTHSIDPAWDGHRLLVTRVDREVRLASADFRDWTAIFPTVVAAVARLGASSLVMDGVVCAFDSAGRPSFERLHALAAEGRAVLAAVLVVWDLLHLDGEDLRPSPLFQRRARLLALLSERTPALSSSPELQGGLVSVRAALRGAGMRGLVARPNDGAYPTSDTAAAWFCLPTADGDSPVVWERSLSAGPPLTHRDKVLYPRDGISKADIVKYYREIAPALLPFLRDRPVVAQRWPDGIDEFTWYQHRVPPRAPDYLRAVTIEGVRRLVIDNEDALLWMVNQAALTFHGFPSRVSSLSSPDWATLDLDPGPATSWKDTIEVAVAVRRTLDLLELPSVVKTSGQKGLHVFVPLAPGHRIEQAEALALGVSKLLCRLMPDRVTLEMEIEKRQGRLLLDYRQFEGKTLVLPYSLRAVDRAPVSAPLDWSEVTEALVPKVWNLRTMAARVAQLGDLAAPLLVGRAVLGPALARLAAQR